jgi:membrane-bound metal-dependent hydrolase YbcI (DUF457 family)
VDPLSHAVLGAAVAHGLFGRRLGLKAAAWGAAAAVLPDIDIFFRVGADDFTALARHRGLTHGLAFAPLLGSLWGYLLARHYARGSPSTATLWRWIGVVTIALWSHPLLDWLTPYGTQLLQPFSDRRFALPVMPIIDPIYTLLLSAGVLLAWRWAPAPRARVASLTAVALSCAYIGYSAHLNDVAEDIATAQLAAMGVTDADVTAYPTLLQIQYRRVVARSPNVDRTGFVNASTPCTIDWGVCATCRRRASRATRRDPRRTNLRVVHDGHGARDGRITRRGHANAHYRPALRRRQRSHRQHLRDAGTVSRHPSGHCQTGNLSTESVALHRRRFHRLSVR